MALPINGDGTYHDFTPSSGTVHAAVVGASCSAVNFVSATTVGARDSYRMGSYLIPAGATITGIDVTPCASSPTGSGQLQAFFIANGVLGPMGGTYVLSNTTGALQATTSFTGLSIYRTTATTLEVGVTLVGGTSVRLSGLQVRVNYTAPAPFLAPGNLAAIDLTATDIALSWIDNTTTESNFRIERSMNGTDAWNVVATLNANVTSYTDIRLTSDQNYYYRAQAINQTTGQTSPYSNVTSAITYSSPPSAPRNLWLALNPASITLSWMKLSNNDDGAAVERSSDGVTFAEIGRTTSGSNSFTDPVAPTGGAYYYRVRTFNVVGSSGYSNVASNVSSPTDGPDLRVGLSATEVSGGTSQTTSFTVSYSNVGTEDSSGAYLTTMIPANTTFDPTTSSPDWRCHNPTSDMFKLTTNIGGALRAFKTRYPNIQQVFISSQMYSGYAAQAGVTEPFAFEGGLSVRAAVEAQMNQVRTGSVDPLVGDLDYRTGKAPWAAWGPYIWANGATANGQGLTYILPNDFGSDNAHPSTAGGQKIAGYILDFFLSSPLTGWFRSSSVPGIPILPVAQLPSPPALIDMPSTMRYAGLSGGLYTGGNTMPADHLAAGLDAASRIQPLDVNGLPSATGRVLFLSIGYSNTQIEFNAFLSMIANDGRVRGAPLRIFNGAIGGGTANFWADPTHGNYDVVKSWINGYQFTEKQVQAIWFNAANNAGPTTSLPLAGTAAGITCKLPIGSLPRGARGTATFTVKTSFAFARPISLATTLIDDGSSGTDLAPPDNAASLAFTVSP